ncbi:nnp-1 protein putative nuclear protein 1 nop52 [Anaeramoeba flamelloides]|uniref:Nnp-1 protein putative nuclear protein 1 nop52 n=1 Tax=Anaeramoeba flamelloides TaxID=1746091 RepID=A0ABQ8YHA9_9EUKA|nr:nnp-1 protein putative nuclear protein 1 nop52 [Anaeramoeba flamelloides]
MTFENKEPTILNENLDFLNFEDLEDNLTPILDLNLFGTNNGTRSSNSPNKDNSGNTNNDHLNYNPRGNRVSLQNIPSLDTKFMMYCKEPFPNMILEEESGNELLGDNNGAIIVKSEIEEPISIPKLKPSVSQRSLLLPEREFSFSEFSLKMEDPLPRFVPPPEFYQDNLEDNHNSSLFRLNSGMEFENYLDHNFNDSFNKKSISHNTNAIGNNITMDDENEIKEELKPNENQINKNNKENNQNIVDSMDLNPKQNKNENKTNPKFGNKVIIKKIIKKKNKTIIHKNKNKNNKPNEEEDFDLKMFEKLSLKDPQKRKRELKTNSNSTGNNKSNSNTSKSNSNENPNQTKNNLKRLDSTIIESGKDVFKLLVGQLWVISGGAPQKFLTPYTKEIARHIGKVFNASENETKNFQSQLKYLLSNSRRTFTEFILELIIGLISLIHSNDPPEISKQLYNVLIEINKLNSMDNLNKEQDKQLEELKMQLERIYQDCISYKTLLYWFNKRYVDRLTNFFSIQSQREFSEKHLFFLGKSKFILSCLLLIPELIKTDGIIKEYFPLINRDYENNVLNLYINNRGGKAKLANQIIREHGINHGKYWSMISKDYCERLNFTPKTIFDHLPFKEIIENPSLANLCRRNYFIKPEEKKKVLAKEKKIKVKINANWLHKKSML